MRIGINLLYLLPGKVGGTETYARGLLDGLMAVDSANEYLVFLNEESEGLELPSAANLSRIPCGVRGTFRGGRYAWEQLILPGRLSQHRVDVLHSLGYVCPFKTPCANIVTIHDANFVALRETLPWLRRKILGFFIKKSARIADHVVAGSHFSRDEILRHMGIPSEKVTVTHLGRGVSERPAADVPWDALSELYGVRKPYILSFSSPGAHKNIDRLVRVFGRIAPDIPHSLLIVGNLPGNSKTSGLIQNRVIAAGHVPDGHVMPLLSHAELFVFPSLYEGFGFPILEAQQAGTPVACSRVASLPEIAGEGACYFDPVSEADMESAIRRCLTDLAVRRSLVLLGRQNALRFSWKKAASETLHLYQKMSRSSGSYPE